MSWWWVLLLVVVLVGLGWYLSTTAGRLDRMHRRVEVSLGNLEGALERRRDAADHVASVGLLDPASSLLIADAVAGVDQVAASDRVQRYVAESDLSTVLSNVFSDPAEVAEIVTEPGGELVLRLADSCRRVEIGRRFYNDAVYSTRSMRSWPVVRTFRLQGRAAMPETVEMVDTPPDGFAGL